MHIKAHNARCGISLTETLVALFMVSSVMITMLMVQARALRAGRRAVQDILITRALCNQMWTVDRLRWAGKDAPKEVDLPAYCPTGKITYQRMPLKKESEFSGYSGLVRDVVRAEWSDERSVQTRELVRLVHDEEFASDQKAKRV